MDLNNDLLPYLSKDGKIINISAGNNPENLDNFNSDVCQILNDYKITEEKLR